MTGNIEIKLVNEIYSSSEELEQDGNSINIDNQQSENSNDSDSSDNISQVSDKNNEVENIVFENINNIISLDLENLMILSQKDNILESKNDSIINNEENLSLDNIKDKYDDNFNIKDIMLERGQSNIFTLNLNEEINFKEFLLIEKEELDNIIEDIEEIEIKSIDNKKILKKIF